jgi:hypothetical protein
MNRPLYLPAKSTRYQRVMSAIKQGYAKYFLFERLAIAAPQILMIATWLAYIITTISLCNTGLHLMSTGLSTDIETAQLELRSQGKLQHTQQLLQNHTDALLYTQLSWGFWESYEDCLARGLGEVDHKLFGLGF